MSSLQVTFKAGKPATLKTLVLIRKPDAQDGEELRFTNGDETRTLESGIQYSVYWEAVGNLGDTLNVDYSADDGQTGTLIGNFTISSSHPDCKPWPGGIFVDYGSNILHL